jgi:sortase A
MNSMFGKGSRYGMVTISRLEQIFLVVGLTLIAVWASARFHSAISSKAAIAQFAAAADANSSENAAAPQDPFVSSPSDFRLWSPKRIAAYEDSLAKKTDLPLAILRIRKVDLEVPVFNDTDDLTLNRGVGRILGTARIGESGNLGIAGHRDGFFRGLEDISAGDVIELIRPGHTDEYAVNVIRIVTPDDVSVLDPTPVPTLTLVTCFPFYFVGHAPQRYIVTAPLKRTGDSAFGAEKDAIFHEQQPHKQGEKK